MRVTEHLFIDCSRLCSKKNSCWLKILSEFLFSNKILYYFYSVLKYSLNIWKLNSFINSNYWCEVLYVFITDIWREEFSGFFFLFFSFKSKTCKIKVIFLKNIFLKTQIKVYSETIFGFKGFDLYEFYAFDMLFDINNSFQCSEKWKFFMLKIFLFVFR